MAHYNLIFQGKIIEGASLEEVKNNVAKLFKADAAKTATLFSGKSIVIKKNLDKETTKKYLSVFKKAGAVVNAVKMDNEMPVELPDSAAENKQAEDSNDSPAPSSGPPSTGLSSGLASLINYNNPSQSQDSPTPQVNHTETPERSSVAAQGSNSETFPDSDDTLKLAPANSGTLSQKAPQEAVELPDIQHLSMSDAQSGSLEEFAPAIEAVELPNTDDLSMSEANTGSLEEFAVKAEAVEIPDISDLDLAEQNDTPLSSEAPKPEPVDIPDVSSLTMSEAEQGSLEGIATKPEPVEIPDTSHLDIEKPEEKQENSGKAIFQID